ncbi:DAK2 domain-containing protein [Paenibacillus sp. LMG 31456]|uniref:DAK2 domain-containing protein n=2 Tax=Paenibacillus foliorum TaxID=2654974 RepID=A0A972GWP8_9BACL|nr:DAK2 domain-containing protein [Paenibacillus foliorum]NOU95207.1 DAK2 domain-containing protein [Paenibacillus foliorum]
MVEKGAQQLRDNVEKVNALNVFPVPDGDTGTNMNLTFTSGVEELKRRPSQQIGTLAEALAKGLLMGARGNSGVILSQLFRGFSKEVMETDSIDARQFAAALQNGVNMAYKAVVKPVEGTILTVAKEAAKHAVKQAGRITNVVELMREVCDKGREALSKTPDLLPILKQVGVVDAGGQGLLLIYEGFLQALEQVDGETGSKDNEAEAQRGFSAAGKGIPHGEPKRAQAQLSTEDIEFGYCTEFMVTLQAQKQKLTGLTFDEQLFRQELSNFGDSLLVVADDDLVKVHIHAEFPGTVMNHAMQYGALSRIKIENMRDQHTHLLLEEAEELYRNESELGTAANAPSAFKQVSYNDGDSAAIVQAENGIKRYGFVGVSVGQGISNIFNSLGVDQVLHGGQTMNPSTEDIVNAVRLVPAHTVFVLPNNSNIILAAKQAVDLVEDKQIVVIPTKSIPQGIAAVLAFQENAVLDENTESMNEAISQVQSGQITHAVRDTRIDDIDIKQGDYIGIHNSKIVNAEPDLVASCKRLIDSLLNDGAEIVTMYTGEEAAPDQTEQLVSYIEETYKEVEVEVHAGGQPLYYYIVSAE